MASTNACSTGVRCLAIVLRMHVSTEDLDGDHCAGDVDDDEVEESAVAGWILMVHDCFFVWP